MADELYKTLGVEKGSNKAEIRKSYKSLAQQHHPDRENGSEAAFKALKSAFDTLYDEEARAFYDRTGGVKSGPNKRQIVLGEVANAFVQVVRANINQFNRVNLVEKTSQQFRENLRKLKLDMNKLRDGAKKLAGAKKRLKPDNSLLIGVLDEEIQKVDAGLAEAEKRKEILEMALEVLKDYDYEIDAQPTAPTFPGFVTYTSPTTHTVV